jgi:putative two-component system response regulator
MTADRDAPDHSVDNAAIELCEARRVLVVDDSAPFAAALSGLLKLKGFVVDVACDGASAMRQLEQHPPDVVLLDVELPGEDGFAVCRRLKHNEATRLTPVVLLTGLRGAEHRLAGIEAGADDFLTKPFDASELIARVRSLSRLKRYTDELESAESVIMSLALIVEARDAYTEGHCDRLSAYAVGVGRRMGLPEGDLAALRRGGLMHDVGKIGIPDAVLLKPSRLTPREFAIVKQHTIIGERLCAGMRSLAPVRTIIRQHHERLDGSGYPDGLRGEAISPLAQIIGVVDAFDAMTTDRPYRRASSHAYAVDELYRDVAHGRFGQAVVEAFADVLPGLADRIPTPNASLVSSAN